MICFPGTTDLWNPQFIIVVHLLSSKIQNVKNCSFQLSAWQTSDGILG